MEEKEGGGIRCACRGSSDASACVVCYRGDRPLVTGIFCLPLVARGSMLGCSTALVVSSCREEKRLPNHAFHAVIV